MWIFLVLLLVPSMAMAGPAEDDYAVRKAGSVAHNDFDNTTADIIMNGGSQNTFPDETGAFRASVDTTIKRSGIGSLRFDIIGPPHGFSNIAGDTKIYFGKTYLPGDTFYLQYAVRWSPWMLTNTWLTTHFWKAGLMCFANCTCAPIGLVMVNWNSNNLPLHYSECGNKYATMDPANLFSWRDYRQTPVNYVINGHDFNCQYANWNLPAATCAKFIPNVWHTYTYQVTLGAWGTGSSTIKLEVWTEAQATTKKIIHITDYPFTCNNPPGCSGNTEGFNRMELSGAYMTNLQDFEGMPFPATVHYDEFIVSDNPIPAPTVLPADATTKFQMASGGSMSGGGSRR